MPRTKTFDEKEVLKKAMNVFWKKGYNGTSMQDLVDNLGVNRASIYATYGNKEALFQKTFEQYQRDSHEAVLHLLDTYNSVKDGLSALFHWAVDDTLTDDDRKGCFAVNIAGEIQPGDVDLRKKLLDNQNFMVGVFKSYLKRGQDKGEISMDKDLDALAMYLYTLSNGVRVVAKVENDRDKLDRMLKSALSVLN
jgi:TetR/AcrR family transcriptional repressor of nem operon